VGPLQHRRVMVFCLSWNPKRRVEPLVQDQERAFVEEIQAAERCMQKARDSVLDARHCISKALDMCRDAQRDTDHWALRVYSPAQVRVTEAAMLRLRVEVMAYIDVDAMFRKTDESHRTNVGLEVCRLAAERLKLRRDADTIAADETLWPAVLTRRNVELVRERDSLLAKFNESSALLSASAKREKAAVCENATLTQSWNRTWREVCALRDKCEVLDTNLRQLKKDRTTLLAELKKLRKIADDARASIENAERLRKERLDCELALSKLTEESKTWLAETEQLRKEKAILAGQDPEALCPITLDVIRLPLRTKCGHVFEANALWTWNLKSNGRCPVCRRRIEIA
jgi:hypothetical protein